MPRKWLKSIGSVCLVAFLIANSHASTAIAISLNDRHSPVHHHDCLEQTCHNEDCTSGHDESCPGHDDPADSPCPCCPKAPLDQSCPCPGGCVFCSVAKVPCNVVPVISGPEALCLGEKICESRSLYLPPVHSALIRPPRS